MSFFAELKRRNVLRVAAAYLALAWLLVEVGSTLLPTFHAPEWVLQVLVLLLAAGFLATLVFAWIYELTPEGLKRDSEVDPDRSIAHRTARKLDIAVIALLLAVGGVTLWTHRRPPPSAPAPLAGAPSTAGADAKLPASPTPAPVAPAADNRPSVAVLPFVNMSSVAENEYFADGLSETLLNMLAQVSGLKVAARTSAFAFKGSKTDIREIARTLDVRTVLEGSVQRAGDRVRITAQLIDAGDGGHLWSKSYDRTLDDIFAIQDEIASEVATALTRSLMGQAPGAVPAIASLETHDAGAYDLYLRGLEKRNLYTYVSLPEAERLFKQALAKDPDFNDARIALARTYLDMGNTGLITLAEAAERGRTLLAPLLAGNDDAPVPRAIDALLQWRSAPASTKSAALRHLQDTLAVALQQSPNVAELYELSAIALRAERKRPEYALAVIERGLALDPLSSVLIIAKGKQFDSMKRHDEALAAYARAREVAPNNPTAYGSAAESYALRGAYVDAVLWTGREMAIDRDDHEIPAGAAQYLLTIGLQTEALPWIRRAELLNASGSDTRRVQMLYAGLAGERERVVELASRVLRERRDNRRDVYRIAASVYLAVQHEAAELDKALALLASVAPGVLDTPSSRPESEFDLIALAAATEFRAAGWTAEERAARVSQLAALVNELDPAADLEAGMVGVRFSAMRGDTERAATRLEALLASPGELPPDWHIALRSPALAQAVADPGVVQRLAKLEAEFARQAVRYRELVASSEIKVP